VEISGIVLAGGRSSRMGSDKASLMLDGHSLLHRTVAALDAVADEVVIVRAPGQSIPLVQTRGSLVVVEDPADVCIPYLHAWTLSGDFIDGVQLNTLSNIGSGGVFAPAYIRYEGIATVLERGQEYDLHITSGDYAPNVYAAWIDYNADNDFEGPGEKIGEVVIDDPYSIGTITFSVPTDAALDEVRLRVRVLWNAPDMEPCEDGVFGETEDYTVEISTSTGLATAAEGDLQLIALYEQQLLRVTRTGQGGEGTILLFDAQGRQVKQQRTAGSLSDLPMHGLAAGVYTVLVVDNTGRHAQRVVWAVR
jgi:hypothetical protein